MKRFSLYLLFGSQQQKEMKEKQRENEKKKKIQQKRKKEIIKNNCENKLNEIPLLSRIITPDITRKNILNPFS